MKVGILSDTHIRKGKSLPSIIWDALEDVDLILHAGDILSESVLEELKVIAPVEAVRGNGDWSLDLPEKTIALCGNLRIGVTHGHFGKGNNTPERAFNTFADDKVDIIVFGHSHIPFKSFYDGVLLFNPGSPTDKRSQPLYSLGILTIDDDIFDIEHIFF